VVLLGSNGDTLHGRTVSWASTNANIALVRQGSVFGTGTGTATIVARSENKMATAIMSVRPCGTLVAVRAAPTRSAAVTLRAESRAPARPDFPGAQHFVRVHDDVLRDGTRW